MCGYTLTKNKAMQKTDETGKIFWMSWEDFRQIWTDITICCRSTLVSDITLEIHDDLGCPGEYRLLLIQDAVAGQPLVDGNVIILMAGIVCGRKRSARAVKRLKEQN